MTGELTRHRDRIARMGQLLYGRGLAHGSAGNISLRLDDGSLLVTPTNTCLGMLDPARISHVAPDGTLLSGDKPSKETFFHLAMYAERESARSVVHLHCTHAVGVSCLDHENEADVLPPVTAYHVMKVGKLPLVPYFRPGDKGLAEAVRAAARGHHAMLLANHGPVVAGKSLEDAVWTSEELEESAKLFFLLSGQRTRLLDAEKIAELERVFPS
ncbi:3-oxo-tetronate 4-phosphate decarboxylase [Roseitranquillus sediminis]|uniref:3-oxo-tetronate 4-phosphate decarboxylase n=1 Tax=Roseitranquillus sediminis TaxID=2809051 RepID=UPI001D0CA627|nr:3-oxo-tetronate 4-phosphate decarboxylase [Roseitranquillus sediminis]MBM9595425.1 aldolase [Roseitranquillus sediminis]